MSQTADRTSAARSTTFAPLTAEARTALTTQCLLAIVSGRPLPEWARPRMVRAPRPATVREGIERIVRGG